MAEDRPARFDVDTAVVPAGGGRFDARMDRGWWIERGPNGGYVAAVMLRALTAAVDDPDRTPRSFTVHFLAPPDEGPVSAQTTIERAGRQLSFVTGRLEQGERLLAVAQAVFSGPVAAPEFDESTPPTVPPPEELEPLAVRAPVEIPMRARYDSRWAIGPMPFTAGDRAEVGGWIRLADPRPADHVLLAAIADAWLPSVFSRASERFGVPTIDLTVHFRRRVLPDDEWFLVRFRTRSSIEGFLEEDGEIWSRSGQLVAQSRQLALVVLRPR